MTVNVGGSEKLLPGLVNSGCLLLSLPWVGGSLVRGLGIDEVKWLPVGVKHCLHRVWQVAGVNSGNLGPQKAASLPWQ